MWVTRRAFTLIELLIVVAIIAILAAIAVPNFLEAQTRSKVARVKADERTIATAIEAYTVDYNRPPLSYRFETASKEYRDLTGGANDTSSFARAKRRARASLTTPVAYLSDWPLDPFADKGVVHVIGGGLDPVTFGWYRYEDYATTWWRTDIMQEIGYRWAVGSPGPTRYDYINLIRALRNWINHSNQKVVFGPYDPTNGTMSEGLIIRTNKGPWDKSEYPKTYPY